MVYVLLIGLLAFMIGLVAFVAGMTLVTMWYEIPSRKLTKLEKKMHGMMVSPYLDDEWED